MQAAPEYSSSRHQEGPDIGALSNLRPPPGGSMLIREIREYMREQSSTQCGGLRIKETTRIRTEVYITPGSGGGGAPSGGSRVAKARPVESRPQNSDRLKSGLADTQQEGLRNGIRSPLEALIAMPGAIARGVKLPGTEKNSERDKQRQQEEKDRAEKEKALRDRVSQILPDVREEELSAVIANVEVDGIRNQSDVNAAAEAVKAALEAFRAERTSITERQAEAQPIASAERISQSQSERIGEVVAEAEGIKAPLAEAAREGLQVEEAISEPVQLSEADTLALREALEQAIANAPAQAEAVELDQQEPNLGREVLGERPEAISQLLDPEGEKAGIDRSSAQPELHSSLNDLSDSDLLKVLDELVERDEDIFSREQATQPQQAVAQPEAFDWSALELPDVDRAGLQLQVHDELYGPNQTEEVEQEPAQLEAALPVEDGDASLFEAREERAAARAEEAELPKSEAETAETFEEPRIPQPKISLRFGRVIKESPAAVQPGKESAKLEKPKGTHSIRATKYSTNVLRSSYATAA